MGLKLKKTNTSKPNKLGHLPQKMDNKKLRIIRISENNNINPNLSSIYDQNNQTKRIEIEHLKSNGLLYSNIFKFR
jgi:hypothetical protein